jgi:glycosyltransferase 2 family protein
MKPRLRKTLLISTKVALAIVLLAWVLSKTHWRDYIVTLEGQSHAILEKADAPDQPAWRVATGFLGKGQPEILRAEQLMPLEPGGDEYVRRGFAATIQGLHKPLVLAAGGVFLASLLVIALRLWVLLRIQRIRVSLWEVVRLTFLGQFFNYVVPGTVGGDLVKAYYLAKHTPRKAAILVSIFVDRVMGFAELTLMAAVMIAVVLVWRLPGYRNMGRPAIAIGALLLLVIGMLTFLLSERVRRLLHLHRLYRRLPIAHHIEAAGDAARLYRERFWVLLRAVAVTFGAHILFVASMCLIGLSLSLQVPWYSYFVYIPLIYIAGAVPLTPGGIGVLEGLYQAFFVAALHCEPSRVLALALLARIIPMLWGIPGAIVAIRGARVPPQDALEAELGID